MEKSIFVFNSTRDAIKAERACLRRGVDCQAVPVPRDITAECGIALEFYSKDRNAVEEILKMDDISAVFYGR